MKITDLETPALLLDTRRMENNIQRMHSHLNGRGVTLRPHLKTAKSVQIAKLLVAGQSGGITVSTLKEADYFASAGFTDILYAVGVTPNKFDHVAKLFKQGIDLTLILDSAAVARAASKYASEAGIQFRFLIEIDCDGHRSGLALDDPMIVAIARLLNDAPGVEFRGLLTHAGGAYGSKDRQEIIAAARHERSSLVNLANKLRSSDIDCPVVSVGSTPTAWVGDNFEGVTEVRAGVFVFSDLLMVNLGVSQTGDVALSVLTSVVAHRPEKGWIITDSGWMSLSADQGTRGQAVDHGFGMVCDIHGNPIEDLTVIATNQEHGIIARRDGSAADIERYPLGTLLRILPIHACATAAAHATYQVVGSDGQSIVGKWERVNGW